jgi:hypothetical protein
MVVHTRSLPTATGPSAKENDAAAAAGVRVRNRDGGAPKLTTSSASPATYFEPSFGAVAAKPYRRRLRR